MSIAWLDWLDIQCSKLSPENLTAYDTEPRKSDVFIGNLPEDTLRLRAFAHKYVDESKETMRRFFEYHTDMQAHATEECERFQAELSKKATFVEAIVSSFWASVFHEFPQCDFPLAVRTNGRLVVCQPDETMDHFNQGDDDFDPDEDTVKNFFECVGPPPGMPAFAVIHQGDHHINQPSLGASKPPEGLPVGFDHTMWGDDPSKKGN
ncbi:MAG: hypothetical protein O2794_01845 [bacterium]|nr:hypothetical protein [bacterium]